MAKRVKRSKRQKRAQAQSRQRQTNWWIVGGVVVAGVVALFGLLALSFQGSSVTDLVDYCAENPARCVATGSPDAVVTVVEVSDFSCTHCRDFHLTTLPALAGEYIDPGLVRWLTLPYALGSGTLPAAEASLCAGEQGAFDAFSEVMFARFDDPGRMTQAGLLNIAGTIGLNEDDFSRCLETERYRDTIEQNIRAARSARVDGTPTFFVGGRRLSGAYPLEYFRQQIDPLLAS